MTPSPNNTDDLQFDTLAADGPRPEDGPRSVQCTLCHQTLVDEYFQVNASDVCDRCRDVLLAHAAVPQGWMLFLRAVGCGVVGAIAGAILYYAVIAITDFEIGFVALAIGYIVGYMIRWGTRGRGGRRFQVAAVVLTYWSVGLAYAPLVVAQSNKQKQAAATAAASPRQQDAPSEIGAAAAIAAVVAFTFALPVLVVFGNLPSGLLSGFIIAIGMRQAWQLTRAPTLNVSGPYKIGNGLASPAG